MCVCVCVCVRERESVCECLMAWRMCASTDITQGKRVGREDAAGKLVTANTNVSNLCRWKLIGSDVKLRRRERGAQVGVNMSQRMSGIDFCEHGQGNL